MDVSKKLARLTWTSGGSSTGRRRRVRAFVARQAARDFYRVLIAGAIIGILFNLLLTHSLGK